jgi:hypothetical protein
MSLLLDVLLFSKHFDSGGLSFKGVFDILTIQHSNFSYMFIYIFRYMYANCKNKACLQIKKNN